MKNYKYFGTDGIRGRVGNIPITPDFLLKLGWATGKVLTNHNSQKIIVGRDTRISGDMLESALKAGLTASGLSVLCAGMIPTPAIAYLTCIFQAEAGIVISGSHNPCYDNGIKFFSMNGIKLPDEIEEAIEIEIKKGITCVDLNALGKISYIVDAADRYINFCKTTFPRELSLNGLKIVIDCANGATYCIAPNVFQELGAKVIKIGCEPDGININTKNGTTDVRTLQMRVVKEKADLGIAFDGDGDRVTMIDHEGNKINGDQILFVIANEKLRQGKLHGGVVGTLMSNIGIELAFKKLNIPFARTKVGDRYILKKLQKNGWIIGAENSGHVILLDKSTTSDGIIASLQVAATMVRNHMNLYDLCKEIKMSPQIMINVYLSNIKEINPIEHLNVRTAIAKVKSVLGNHGRLLLRKSGTESLIRVMVEYEDEIVAKECAHLIANTIKEYGEYN